MRISVSTCDKCQKARMEITKRYEMPQQPILFYEVFDVWGIDFMGPFLVSNGYSYIFLAVDYVSRWVETITTKTNDAKVVVDFLISNIFCQLGVPKALISNQGSHFCNRAMSSLLHKYGVIHRITIAYHPRLMAKLKTGADSLRTLSGRIELHTELRWGCLPTKLSSAVKQCNLDYDQARKQRQFQLQELDKLHLEAYKNSRIYKQKILRKEFRVGQKVLLFNSRLKLIIGKLRSRWDGPFVIINIFPYGVVELKDKYTNNTFQVNGHQIKLYHEGPAPIVGNMETISLMEPTPLDDTP
ncbi:gag-pol, partial [Mucuna pruriens]